MPESKLHSYRNGDGPGSGQGVGPGSATIYDLAASRVATTTERCKEALRKYGLEQVGVRCFHNCFRLEIATDEIEKMTPTARRELRDILGASFSYVMAAIEDASASDLDEAGKAWMSISDIDLLERVLLLKGAAAPDKFNVLEWGSGRSTLDFTELLNNRGLSYYWLSLEHDRRFFETVMEPRIQEKPYARTFVASEGEQRPRCQDSAPSGEFAAFVELISFDAARDSSVDQTAIFDSYISYPKKSGEKFDLILVKGRCRRRCLMQAASVMKHNGVTVLHDADRDYYQCAYDGFRYHKRIGERLWVGAQSAAALDDIV